MFGSSGQLGGGLGGSFGVGSFFFQLSGFLIVLGSLS